jgi:hypothetical protein
MTDETRALIARVRARYVNVHNLQMAPADDDVFALIRTLEAAEARADGNYVEYEKWRNRANENLAKLEAAEARAKELDERGWKIDSKLRQERERADKADWHYQLRLEAEVARLTDALEEILDQQPLHYCVEKITRAALTPKEGK